jgi:uncharacterized protein DUF2505
VRIAVAAPVAVPPAEAIAAYCSPAFYEGRSTGGDVTVLGVVGHEDHGDRVVLEVQFAFVGSVSGAVRRVIDPAKMTWITRTELFVSEARSRWVVLPDHYPDRLRASGTYRFEEGPDGPASTLVRVEGDLKVSVPLVGGRVERVIVSGLRSYIEGEVQQIPGQRTG